VARQAGGTGDADGVGASEETQYLSAFYFAMVTITTVGYGDLLPATEMEREFVMFSIILGDVCDVIVCDEVELTSCSRVVNLGAGTSLPITGALIKNPGTAIWKLSMNLTHIDTLGAAARKIL
jgi:hypothetical protein